MKESRRGGGEDTDRNKKTKGEKKEWDIKEQQSDRRYAARREKSCWVPGGVWLRPIRNYLEKADLTGIGNARELKSSLLNN